MVWTPSAEARAIGESLQGTIPNVQGSQLTSDDAAQIQLAIKPGVRVLASYIKERWRLSSAGMARGASIRRPARRDDGSLRRRDVHEEGRAIDAMIGSDLEKGRQIAEWCVINAGALGLQYVIWDRTEWSSSTYSTAFEAYTGTSPHTDHVHIEVSPSFAGDSERMRQTIFALTGTMPAPLSGGSATPATSRPPAPTTPAPSAEARGGGSVAAGALLGLAGLAAALRWLRGRR